MDSGTQKKAFRIFETAFNRLYDLRLWLTTATLIGIRMTKGAVLTTERNHLLRSLGLLVFQKAGQQKPEDPSYKSIDSEILSVTKKLDKLTRKLEIEEKLIHGLRFGTKTIGTPAEKENGSEH